MKLIHRLVCILMILCLSYPAYAGEEEEEIGDTEYQFSHSYIAKGDNGYYFCVQGFLFYWEEGMDEAIALCSKVDCMHQYEESQEAIRSCEAWTGPGTDTNLNYYNGKIHVNGRDESFREVPFIMDPDGTNREIEERDYRYRYVYGWEPRYHKGYLYFATADTEPLGKGYVNRLSRLWRQIADKSEEPELLFETDYKEKAEIAFVSGFFSPFYLYEDYAYFALLREDGRLQRYIYDLREKKATAVPYRYEDAGNMMVRGFYEDKMIYSYAFEDNREEGRNVFISNLDGSEEELLFTAKPYFFFAGMDENYIYLDDAQCPEIIRGEKHTRTVYIYDKETKELLWEYDMIDATRLDLGLGDDKYLFYLSSDYSIRALDKASLIPGQEPVTRLIVKIPEYNQ